MLTVLTVVINFPENWGTSSFDVFPDNVQCIQILFNFFVCVTTVYLSVWGRARGLSLEGIILREKLLTYITYNNY